MAKFQAQSKVGQVRDIIRTLPQNSPMADIRKAVKAKMGNKINDATIYSAKSTLVKIAKKSSKKNTVFAAIPIENHTLSQHHIIDVVTFSAQVNKIGINNAKSIVDAMQKL